MCAKKDIKKEKVKHWKLYKDLYKESKKIEIDMNLVTNAIFNMTESNIELFLYIILYYEEQNDTKVIVGRHVMNGSKFSLSIKKFPDDLLRLLTLLCKRIN